MVSVGRPPRYNRLISLSPIFQRIADPQLALAVDQLLKIIVKQNEIIEAQQQQIIHLQKTIETQQQKIETLEEKLKINSKNSSTPPSGDGFKKEKNKPAKNKKKGKKRKQGGQMGRKGIARQLLPLSEVDHIEVVSPLKECPCGALVIPTKDYKRHQVHDLPRLKAIVTEYQLHFGKCCKCGETHQAPLPPGVPAGMLAPYAISAIGTLTGDYRLSKRNVAALFYDFYGLRISIGTVSNAEKIVSAALEKSVEEAKNFIPKQSVVHGDETSHAEKGQKMWTWVFIAAQVAAFIIRPSRGAQVVKDFLGEAFQGTLNTDRWSAYTWLAVIFRQLCWAHLKRDFTKIAERKGQSGKIGKNLLAAVKKMFRYWHKVRDGTLSRQKFQELMDPLRKQVETLLSEGASCGNSKTEGTCKQLLKVKQALWTFVDKIGIEPTNNLAEQILRRIVIWRKISFGTQSPRGTLYLERIMTVVATCKMQKRNVLDFVTEAIQAHLSRATPPSLLPPKILEGGGSINLDSSLAKAA
jgi:transposase